MDALESFFSSNMAGYGEGEALNRES